ncbi:MAG: Holliday junction branch migration protein RuvA [Candidatus Nomurabacteria bacterium]|jgi:Holliday junction DNA helicase RuvA|nr:Holliday junction branch migration protein RuvA [Candidatus Nomurabacteria bacterium]
MIAHIFGKVVEKFGDSVIVDVGGVGYEITLSAPDFEKYLLNDEAKIFTYHHVREQSEELFGFSSLAAKKLFELLISVQGVGPKAGMAILSIGNSEQVRNAIANSDAAFIGKATGVGKKTAERVIVDLKDKVGLPTAYATGGIQTALNTSDEALEALMALGFTLNDATLALKTVPTNLSVEDRIRLALKN